MIPLTVSQQVSKYAMFVSLAETRPSRAFNAVSNVCTCVRREAMFPAFVAMSLVFWSACVWRSFSFLFTWAIQLAKSMPVPPLPVPLIALLISPNWVFNWFSRSKYSWRKGISHLHFEFCNSLLRSVICCCKSAICWFSAAVRRVSWLANISFSAAVSSLTVSVQETNELVLATVSAIMSSP